MMQKQTHDLDIYEMECTECRKTFYEYDDALLVCPYCYSPDSPIQINHIIKRISLDVITGNIDISDKVKTSPF